MSIGLIFLSGCSSKEDDDNPDIKTSALPILFNLSIANSSFAITGSGGAFSLTSKVGSTNKPFLEFGGKLIDGGTGPGGIDFFHLTYVLQEGTDVLSPFDGVVMAVDYQSADNDYEIRIKYSSSSSIYTSITDHVLSPTVISGNTVAAGQVIGVVNHSTKYEFDITVDDRSSNVRDCPVKYLDSSVKVEVEGLITQLMQDVETYQNDASLYDQENMPYPGCKVESGGE
jgi:hypothetical protein